MREIIIKLLFALDSDPLWCAVFFLLIMLLLLFRVGMKYCDFLSEQKDEIMAACGEASPVEKEADRHGSD